MSQRGRKRKDRRKKKATTASAPIPKMGCSLLREV